MKQIFGVLAVSLVLFVDPVIFGRTVFREDTLAMGVFSLLAAYLLVANLSGLRQAFSSMRVPCFILAFYSLVSIGARVVAGQELTYLSLHLATVVQITIIAALMSRKGGIDLLTNGYIFASVIHAITALPFFPVLAEGVAQQTAYASGEYAAGIITRRGTGFFNSPGQLTLFAVGGIALSINRFYRSVIGAKQLLFYTSAFLGISALSRSFLVAVSLLVAVALLRIKLEGKVRIIIVGCAFGLIALRTNTVQEYGQLLWSRMQTIFETTSNDRIAGDTGLIESLEVLKNYPLLGSMVAEESRSLMAWNGAMLVRPHTSVVMLVAYYGVLLSMPLLILIFQATRHSIKVVSNLELITPHYASLCLGFLAVNIVCLVEPVIETGVYFLFLMGVTFRPILERK
jgi:hypothetical protein